MFPVGYSSNKFKQEADGAMAIYYVKNFEEQVARLKFICGAYTQSELADIFGVKQASISDAFKRRVIPDKWFLVLVERFGVDPEWIRSGRRPICICHRKFEPAPGIVSFNET